MLTISPELQSQLEQVAQSDGISVNELAEGWLSYYLNQQLAEHILEPEEDAALTEAIAESRTPDAKWYTTEEMIQELEQRRTARRQKKAQNG